MIKKIARPLLVMALTLCVLLTQVSLIKAQGLTPTPTTAEKIELTQTPIVTVTDPNVVTFDMLSLTEIQLNGPYDSSGFSFSVPADWKLTSGTKLDISFGVAYSITDQNLINTVYQGDSTLTVLLDGRILGVIPLTQLGEKTISIPIPLEQLETENTDQVTTLRFVLESGIVCNLNQRTAVYIHPTSQFSLPHELVPPDTNLVNFPRPILQNSFISDSALLVIADKPTAAEMKAALIVSAGLNSLSTSSVTLGLTTTSLLTEEEMKAGNIVFIGNAASLPVLQKLKLPMPIKNNVFENTGGNQDDGIIQLINSPWNNSYVVLVASGSTDVGTVKAAQAISTGVIQPNKTSNLAVIDKVDLKEVVSSQVVDRTLTEMGFSATLFQRRGLNSIQYTFNIPSGFTVSTDAYFDLIYGNSALLDFNRSGIVARLNGRPIGSVRMSVDTANLATNKSRITIPPAAIIPGRNILQINANLVPIDECTPPNVNQGLWVNIWPESLLHLPLIAMSVTPTSTQTNLGSYVSQFVSNPILSDTAFILPENNLDTWRLAVQIAGNLGSVAKGPSADLSVFFDKTAPVSELSKYNLLVIGQPSEMQILQTVNDILPVPFVANSDVPYSTNPQITYRIPKESSMGFLEILPSQWNPQNVILAVLGNSKQGVNWATTALIDPTLTTILTGNFAVVNDRQILTTDTGLISPPSESAAVQNPIETAAPVAEAPVQVQPSATRSDWVLPALGVSVVLIILLIAIVVIGSWSRKRTRRKHE